MCYLGNLEFGLLWNKYRVHTVELWITAAVGDQMIVQTILTGKIVNKHLIKRKYVRWKYFQMWHKPPNMGDDRQRCGHSVWGVGLQWQH